MRRGRKEEKRWARAEADPIKLFEAKAAASHSIPEDLLAAARSRAADVVKRAVEFAAASPPPPRSLTLT
jgi:pyruvate dehydrogenase E1 component alpha subunit